MGESSISKKQQNFDIFSYRNYSNQQLIELCLNNNRKAWEEFFCRFIPVLKKSIQYTLVGSDLGHLYHDKEVLGDIHEKITIKLYKEGKLALCKDTDGIIPWLKTIAMNQTKDWIKRRNRDKRLPQKLIELNTLFLSEPLKGNSDLTLNDTIIYDSQTKLKFRIDLENSLNRIAGINDEKKYWIFRLSLLQSFPLSNNEFKKLSEFCDLTKCEFKKKMNELNNYVETKEAKRLESANKAVLYWYVIKRLKSTLALKRNELDSTNKLKINNNLKVHDKKDIEYLKNQNQSCIKDLEKQIEKKTKLRDSHLKQGAKQYRPSNNLIADLVGMPVDKATQISNILIRIRKTIQKNENIL